MDWSSYVRQVVGTDRQTDVARKTGIDQTTISRWLNPTAAGTTRISSQSVARFARGYDVPVLQAFVAAGFLTPEEAGMEAHPPLNLAEVPADVLAAELHDRLRGA